MHHIHFRYVSAVPRHQNCSSLFQLLDDINPRQRTALLQSAYVQLRVSGDDDSSEYREFKRRLNALACLAPDQELIVYGMVCFILGSVLRRITHGIFQFVDIKRTALERSQNENASQQIAFLREEEHELRLAYQSFCEMVVSDLLNDQSGVDDGIDLLIDESAQTPIQQNEAPIKPLLDDFVALKKLSDQLFPSNEDVRPVHPAVVTFLDQLAANFKKTIRNEDDVIVIQVVDKSARVAVRPYSEPTSFDPLCPLVLRITICGTKPYDDDALRALGLPKSPVSSLDCRLEFSVLPNELSLSQRGLQIGSIASNRVTRIRLRFRFALQGSRAFLISLAIRQKNRCSSSPPPKLHALHSLVVARIGLKSITCGHERLAPRTTSGNPNATLRLDPLVVTGWFWIVVIPNLFNGVRNEIQRSIPDIFSPSELCCGMSVS